jgi:hypothetical protein
MKNKINIANSRIMGTYGSRSKVVLGLRASKLAALAKNL